MSQSQGEKKVAKVVAMIDQEVYHASWSTVYDASSWSARKTYEKHFLRESIRVGIELRGDPVCLVDVIFEYLKYDTPCSETERLFIEALETKEAFNQLFLHNIQQHDKCESDVDTSRCTVCHICEAAHERFLEEQREELEYYRQYYEDEYDDDDYADDIYHEVAPYPCKCCSYHGNLLY